MSKRLWRVVSVLAGTALATVLAAGCGSSPSAATTANEPTVVIGYENNGADPEMVAIAKNYFATYMHAHVKLRYFSSGPASLAALAAGSLQFMTGIGNPPAAAAISQGVPVKVIWAQELYTRDEGLVVREGSGITSLKDLAGKQLALVVGSTSPFEVAAALKAEGLPQTSVQFVNMTPQAMVAAWERGQLDAAYVWDPAFDTMLQDHGVALMYDQNVEQTAPIFNLAVVQGPWAKTHAALVRGFIEAEQAGVAYTRSHPAQAVQEMAKEAGISVALARTEIRGFKVLSVAQQLSEQGLGSGSGVKTSLVTRSLAASAGYLQSIHQITKAPGDMSSYVDPSYAQYVAHHR